MGLDGRATGLEQLLTRRELFIRENLGDSGKHILKLVEICVFWHPRHAGSSFARVDSSQ
jgi:hypothetical protein